MWLCVLRLVLGRKHGVWGYLYVTVYSHSDSIRMCAFGSGNLMSEVAQRRRRVPVDDLGGGAPVGASTGLLPPRHGAVVALGSFLQLGDANYTF